jgi:hypothetical protein
VAKTIAMKLKPYLSIKLCTLRLKESTIFEVILDDNISDCVKHELNIVSIRGTGEMSVNFFRILPLIQVFELQLNVRRSFLVRVGA